MYGRASIIIDVRANIYTRVYIYTRANNYIVARQYIIYRGARQYIIFGARQYIDVARQYMSGRANILLWKRSEVVVVVK